MLRFPLANATISWRSLNGGTVLTSLGIGRLGQDDASLLLLARCTTDEVPLALVIGLIVPLDGEETQQPLD
jgi:hypothetical protein